MIGDFISLSNKDRFRLTDKFIENYVGKQPNWGFGFFSYLVYKRTYSRDNEEFYETIRRVVEGVYNVQLAHCKMFKLPWNPHKAQKSAQKMYDLMWNFKFLPAGRGLWAMGTNIIPLKGSAALQNCGFISTEEINVNFSEPFVWAMDMLMLGVGIGFDTKGEGLVTIIEPKKTDNIFVIPDSREGWCEAIKILLDSYVGVAKKPIFDFSLIRKAGTPIRTMGGFSPGPEVLKKAIETLENYLDKIIDKKITSVNIVDIMNIIGRCVVSGGIRRTAQISLGRYNDFDFISMKDPDKYSDLLYEWRWASNNSVIYNDENRKISFKDIAEFIKKNGEPGIVNINNCRSYGRMINGPDNKDYRVCGVNPCGEQTLENYELCNLVEVFPSKCEDEEDFYTTLKYAYLYAKTVSLIPTHVERTNQVMLRNRRIGLSLSGITDAFFKFGRRRFLYEFCDKGYKFVSEYDKKYSEWMCVPESIKKTTVKPSGTISLLAGVSPGIHYSYDYYVRRIRIGVNDPLNKILKNAGIPYEKSAYNDNTNVYSFYIKSYNCLKSRDKVSIYEQLENAVDIQRFWSDNSISQTVVFNEEEAEDLANILEMYIDKLKTISLLPNKEGIYKQLPIEKIDKDVYYNNVFDKFVEININNENAESPDKYCDSSSCFLE